MTYFQQVAFCRKFSWFEIPASVKISELEPESEMSCSTPIFSKSPKKPSVPIPMYSLNSPCNIGKKYWCFSKATAKYCNYVSISLLSYNMIEQK